jgi:hypothetical protein
MYSYTIHSLRVRLQMSKRIPISVWPSILWRWELWYRLRICTVTITKRWSPRFTKREIAFRKCRILAYLHTPMVVAYIPVYYNKNESLHFIIIFLSVISCLVDFFNYTANGSPCMYTMFMKSYITLRWYAPGKRVLHIEDMSLYCLWHVFVMLSVHHSH